MNKILIQVQDCSGNWITVQLLKPKTSKEIEYHLSRAQSQRPTKNLRVVPEGMWMA